jgi:hypothetical protein
LKARTIKSVLIDSRSLLFVVRFIHWGLGNLEHKKG